MELEDLKLNTWYKDEDNYYFYPININEENGEIDCHVIDNFRNYEHEDNICLHNFPNPVEVPYSEVAKLIPSEYSKDNYGVWN